MSTKRARRAERLRAAELEEHRLATTTPRDLRDDVYYRGVGHRRLQVARVPSLVPAICFEVRGEPLLAASPLAETAALPERLRLYRSTGTKPGSRLVVGYDEFEVPDGLLLGFFARIARVPIFAVPEVPLYCVADAVHLELAVGCGLGDLRVEWVEGCAPTAWTELEQIAKEMLATFETLSPIG